MEQPLRCIRAVVGIPIDSIDRSSNPRGAALKVQGYREVEIPTRAEAHHANVVSPVAEIG
jgi:hypothetical protein